MTTLKIPLTIELNLESLEELRRQLVLPATTRATPPAPDPDADLPVEWRFVEDRHQVTYTWGGDTDTYEPFTVYEADNDGDRVRLAIGKCDRTRTFGEERVYFIVMALGPAGGMRAISEFLATDDYDETRDVIAIIKGKEGTAQQFDLADELPPAYSRWQTLRYRDRVNYPGAYSKQALVCNENDHETMLNHSLTQIRLRGL